ncbi:MAG TPA: hypothetical protein PLC32_06895 [Candidatus Omnitrophota bacterium]|nr:hypothetical protein [Candidatus Omnitrophota bacterium]
MIDSSCKNKGFTLIELIILVLVVAILGATIVGSIIFFVQMFVYSPRQLDTQKIANEMVFTIMEGNKDTRGIRYTRKVIDASAMQFSYTYGYPTSAEQLSVRFRWNALDKHIYRSTSTNGGVSWSAETAIPYYISPSVTVDGRNASAVIFSYKKADGTDWVSGTDPVTEIRRVIMSINVKTGTGAFGAQEGSLDTTTGVEIKGF